jgi:ribonuclease D
LLFFPFPGDCCPGDRPADGGIPTSPACGLSFTLAPLISTTAELNELAARIRESAWVALDTEADSLHAYPEKLCLVQLAIPGHELLVDPLGDLHLEPLWAALDGRELVFHAADYDLRLIYQGHHFRPTAIFDTMWAARLLGESHFGLSDVVSHFLGITLEKGSQKANWGRRPLTERMINYALADVRHLRALEVVLRERLVERGRLEWHQQTCQRLIDECARPEVVDAETVWRIKGHDKLDETGLAVLRDLWYWREEEARRVNRPPFFVLSHEMLSGIAGRAARDGLADLTLPHFLSQRRRRGVLDAAERGLAVAPAERPVHLRPKLRRLTRRELHRADVLRMRRDRHAKELGIDPTIIAAKATIYALAREDGQEWDALIPWQRTLLKD